MCCSSSCVTCVLWGCSRCCPWVPVWVSLCSCCPWLPPPRAELLQGEVLWHTLFSSCTSAVIPDVYSPLCPLNSAFLSSTELVLFICANICWAQLVVQWKPNILCSAAASACAGCAQDRWGGQDHPCVPSRCWELHQGCSLSCPSQSPGQPRALELPGSCWSWSGFAREPQPRTDP